MQGLEGQEREEVEWGEVLHVVYSGLVATRRLLWDESERKIIALLSSSSAFEGDHFLQVRVPSHKPAFTQSTCMHPTYQAAGGRIAAVIQFHCDGCSGQLHQRLHSMALLWFLTDIMAKLLSKPQQPDVPFCQLIA